MRGKKEFGGDNPEAAQPTRHKLSSEERKRLEGDRCAKSTRKIQHGAEGGKLYQLS